MAKFVKGDYVQTVPKPDIGWEHWTSDNTDMCNKIVKVVDVEEDGWANDIHIEVEYQGVRAWFGDKHLIKVKKYEDIYSQAIHDAVYKLNETEKVCKRVRDEILQRVFGEDPPPSKKKDKDVQLVQDELFEDWEDLITKDMFPLPGKDTDEATTEEEAKALKSKLKKKKTSKGKIKKSKLPSTKKKIYSSRPKGSVQTLVDEELCEEIKEFLDSLPPHDTTDDTGDFDFEYFFGDDGNAD